MKKKKSEIWRGLRAVVWTILLHYALACYNAISAPPRSEGVFWGVGTNGIFVGFRVERLQGLTSLTNPVPILCHPLLYYNSTNNRNITPSMLLLYLPPVESRYRLELTDAKGNSVEKTASGKALGKTVPRPYKPSANRHGVTIDTGWRPAKFILLPEEVRGLQPPLMLQDYFKITNSGKYGVHFEVCAFKAIDNKTNELIHFPPVDAQIDIILNPK